VFIDKPVVRVTVKVIIVAAAGFSGFLAQTNVVAAGALLVVSIAFTAVEYLLSGRITTLVVERVSGIIESACACCTFPADADVRGTVFAPSRNSPDKLRQVCRYHPTDRYSSFRRGLPNSKGIIGLCYRSRQQCLEAIDEGSSFKAYMVSKWGFTQEEADAVKIRRSYLAIPVLDQHGNALGVAYYDSIKKDAFPPDKVDILTRACAPLSRWVR
jgi:hypothetical protein